MIFAIKKSFVLPLLFIVNKGETFVVSTWKKEVKWLRDLQEEKPAMINALLLFSSFFKTMCVSSLGPPSSLPFHPDKA